MRRGGSAIAYRASCRTLANDGSCPTFRAPPRINPERGAIVLQTSFRSLTFAIAAVAGFPLSLVAQARPAATTTPAAVTATTRRAFTPADWYKLTTVASPAVSPDGKLVAFTVTTVRESENKRHNEVWVVPVAGGDATRYTSPSTESSNPRFSADGKYLLFNSTRTGSGVSARTFSARRTPYRLRFA